ncbi:hypothetical protein TRVL_00480 [Trypanosoma vivax]|nr:hypothetical protein TRVL_00480 [Trypanosoma vivax]
MWYDAKCRHINKRRKRNCRASDTLSPTVRTGPWPHLMGTLSTRTVPNSFHHRVLLSFVASFPLVDTASTLSFFAATTPFIPTVSLQHLSVAVVVFVLCLRSIRFLFSLSGL